MNAVRMLINCLLLALLSCSGNVKPTTLPSNPTACIPADDPYPRWPGLPGADECVDDQVCLPKPDWKALIDYRLRASDWMRTYSTLCKEDNTDGIPHE